MFANHSSTMCFTLHALGLIGDSCKWQCTCSRWPLPCIAVRSAAPKPLALYKCADFASVLLLTAAGNVVLNSKFYEDTSGNILNEICECQC